jgi:hypothetical protein
MIFMYRPLSWALAPDQVSAQTDLTLNHGLFKNPDDEKNRKMLLNPPAREPEMRQSDSFPDDQSIKPSFSRKQHLSIFVKPMANIFSFSFLVD